MHLCRFIGAGRQIIDNKAFIRRPGTVHLSAAGPFMKFSEFDQVKLRVCRVSCDWGWHISADACLVEIASFDLKTGWEAHRGVMWNRGSKKCDAGGAAFVGKCAKAGGHLELSQEEKLCPRMAQPQSVCSERRPDVLLGEAGFACGGELSTDMTSSSGSCHSFIASCGAIGGGETEVTCDMDVVGASSGCREEAGLLGRIVGNIKRGCPKRAASPMTCDQDQIARASGCSRQVPRCGKDLSSSDDKSSCSLSADNSDDSPHPPIKKSLAPGLGVVIPLISRLRHVPVNGVYPHSNR